MMTAILPVPPPACMPSTFSDAGTAVLLAEEPADGAAIAGVAINAMEAVAAISLFNTTCCLPLFDSLADQLPGFVSNPAASVQQICAICDPAPLSTLGFKKLNGNAVKR